MNVIAILTAAGSGKRFSINAKKKFPKQFIKLLGKPVIVHSLIAIQKCSRIKQVFVSSNKEYFDLIYSFVLKYKLSKLAILVEGGNTRFESVKNAFSQIKANDSDLILIHDAARPNITSQMLDNMIKFAEKKGNTVIGTGISDTVKQVKKGIIHETVSREDLFTVQTPQIFKYKDLFRSYKKNKSKKAHTDESSMVESAGFKVNLFTGTNENVKLTSKDDLKILNKLMS